MPRWRLGSSVGNDGVGSSPVPKTYLSRHDSSERIPPLSAAAWLGNSIRGQVPCETIVRRIPSSRIARRTPCLASLQPPAAPGSIDRILVVLKILHGPFVLFSRCPAAECAEISALARSRVSLAGVQTVFSGVELSNHLIASFNRYRVFFLVEAVYARRAPFPRICPFELKTYPWLAIFRLHKQVSEHKLTPWAERYDPQNQTAS
jgi:hypothetical protein